MESPLLSVVVAAWNQLELTRRCVASVRANTDVPYELIVVDNGSDKAAAAFAAEAADLPILNDTNRGFAPAMNQGLAAAGGTFVAFVNNDTLLPPLWATRLLETFAATPGCGIVLPAVTAAGNPFAVRDAPGPDVIEVPPFGELPSGVAYVMERPTASELGGWGEEFLVASREDLDLLFKVWANGLRVVLDERVLVEHESSATVSAQLPDQRTRWAANWEVFIAKWVAADPATVPRIARCDPATFTDRLETARVAATWMARWHDAEERARVLRQESRRASERQRHAEAELLDLRLRRGRWLRGAWSAARSLVPGPLRERLFPRLRGLYYTAYPERKGGRVGEPGRAGGRNGASGPGELGGDDRRQGIPPIR